MQSCFGELKRKLAEIKVKKTRIAELRDIIAALNADSDKAADEHSIDAGKLQAELDVLDAGHVDAILAGKTSPAKSIPRRRSFVSPQSTGRDGARPVPLD